MRTRWGVAAAGVLLLLAGCGSPEEDPVGRVAGEWLAAAGAGDAQRMCSLLTPAAARSVATGGDTCEQAVGDLDLPGAGPVRRIEVWSDEAQVVAASDTLFLVRLTGGWRVNAAGCAPQQDRPYDCDVEG